MSHWRLMLCWALLSPGVVFAQATDEWTPYTPSAPEQPVAPPLVPATPPPEPPSQTATPTKPRPRGEIIPRNLDVERATSTQTVLRLIITPWSGAITGMMGVIVGTVPTTLLALPLCLGTDKFGEAPRCTLAIGAGLAVSYSVGVTLGIIFAGKLMGGRGDGLLTFLGALAGAAAGSGIGIANRDTATLILGLSIGPLLGALVAYELSHALLEHPTRPGVQARARARIMPMAGLTPRGGVLAGLTGRF